MAAPHEPYEAADSGQVTFVGNSHPGAGHEAFLQEQLTGEEYRAWQAMRASSEEERTQSQLEGETAYDRALEKEDSEGTEAALKDFAIAANALVHARALEVALETESLRYAPNPVRFFKIADSYSKLAAAEEVAPYSKPGAVTAESQRINRRTRLAYHAVRYWDQGVDALLAGEHEELPDIHMPENPTELVAEAVAEAVHDVSEMREHSIITGSRIKDAEHRLSTQLQAVGASGIKAVVEDDIKRDDARLEVVGRSSEILNEHLTDA